MPDNFVINNSAIANRFYTIVGHEDFLDENGYPRINNETDFVLAKAIQNKKPRQLTNKNFQYRYYVKTNPLKILYNPIEIHSVQDNNKHEYSHLHKTYKNEWVLTEVTESVFNKYKEFLKTKSLNWLKAAQQEIA
jgi:hypothetical protein